MKGKKAIVGVFTYIDDTIHAIEAAKSAGLDFKVFAPFYNHELDHACSDVRSNVRKFNLFGATFGCTAGFALAILCSLDWPMRTSAKDIISIPGFVVIGYEWTILWGAIFTLLGVMILSRVPDIFPKVGFDPRFTQDKFGVAIGCDDDATAEKIVNALKESGAEEVQVRDGM
jgi:Protein of unknown function (DUF3341)